MMKRKIEFKIKYSNCLYTIAVYNKIEIRTMEMKKDEPGFTKTSFLTNFSKNVVVFFLGNINHGCQSALFWPFGLQFPMPILLWNSPICTSKHGILVLPCQTPAFKSQSSRNCPLNMVRYFNRRFPSFADEFFWQLLQKCDLKCRHRVHVHKVRV
ncbi:hypothetical protein RND81_12G193900 [Saponaria officinalis]|uniref:Uncharacterized protein n=1 Tax=Saponaria officinalis TaxID=3572 RepID=A0AAW1HCU6_SAPOF